MPPSELVGGRVGLDLAGEVEVVPLLQIVGIHHTSQGEFHFGWNWNRKRRNQHLHAFEKGINKENARVPRFPCPKIELSSKLVRTLRPLLNKSRCMRAKEVVPGTQQPQPARLKEYSAQL